MTRALKQAAKQSTQLLRQAGLHLFTHTSDGAFLVDAAERIIQANRAVARLLACSADDLIGRPLRQVLALGLEVPLQSAKIRLSLDGLPKHYFLRCAPLPNRGKQHHLIQLELDPAEDTSAIVARMLRQERQLHEVAVTITSKLDITMILDRVVQLAIELIGADAGSLPLYDVRSDSLWANSAVNIQIDPKQHVLPRNTGALWAVLNSGESVIYNNYQQHPDALPSLIRQGTHAVIGVPVRNAQHILGVLVLYYTQSNRSFSAHDRELLEIVGRQAAVALQNAELYQRALHEAAKRHILYQASIDIGAALDPEQIYQAIHAATVRLMPCTSIAIALYHAVDKAIDYVYIRDQQRRWPAVRLPIERGLLGYVVAEGISLRMNNTDSEMESWFGAERFHGDAEPTRAMLAVPLQVGDSIIGAMTVQSLRPDAYDSCDLDMLEMLATTTSIALQNAQLFAKIHQMATTDALTNIPNRRYFFELAERELERTIRYGHTLSVVMFDADNFKAINDTYGHIAGDQVLREIAQRCRENLREVDVIARYGGEEFVILLPETGYEHALQVAQRLRNQVAQSPMQSYSGPISVSISLGVTSYSAGLPIRLEELLDQADQALYKAKHAGRNQVHGFARVVE